jgi:hypothetical protein
MKNKSFKKRHPNYYLIYSMKKQNLALNYIESINPLPASLKRSEKEALEELIASHKRLREDKIASNERWNNLPKWKEFLARKLGLF